MNRLLITEINRQTGDISPSPYEVFYRTFGQFPGFVHQAGSSDRFGAPTYSDNDDSDEEDEDMPTLGVEYLNKEVASLTKFMEKHEALKSFGQLKIINRYHNLESNIFSAIVTFDVGVMLLIRVSPSQRSTVAHFVIVASSDSIIGLDKLVVYAKQFARKSVSKKDKINIITQSNSDFYLKSIPLKPKKKSRFSFKNYNEDFEAVSNHVVKTLSENEESGLVLFHGDPGTGKTSYLKHLLHLIPGKKIIYMPPDLTEHLSSPNFITFMMSEATNSILLIEDAENVLRHREAGGNQAVSNILNLSDGILGDVMKLQIVCTFNSKLIDIDEALLRPGRCIAEYRFEKLSVERAGNLLADLHGEDVEWEPKEMTLAQVFNHKALPTRSKDRTIKLGFT